MVGPSILIHENENRERTAGWQDRSGTVINGSNVTVVFAKDDNPEMMKNVTDLIMSAYAERKVREAQG